MCIIINKNDFFYYCLIFIYWYIKILVLRMYIDIMREVNVIFVFVLYFLIDDLLIYCGEYMLYYYKFFIYRLNLDSCYK